MSDAKLQNDKDDKYSLRGRVFNHIREGILSGRYEENEELKQEFKSKVLVALSEIDPERAGDDNLIKDKMRHTIRTFLNEKFGKKPLMEVHLIRI